MDAEIKAALLTLAEAILSLSNEAASVDEGQYSDGSATTGVRFPMEDELSTLIDRLQADQDDPALPPAGGR